MTAMPAKAREIPYGKFQGSGRACHGSFIIDKKTLSWSTSFSKCQKAIYKILDSKDDSDHTEFSVQLLNVSQKCLYPFVRLSKNLKDSKAIWNVTGFTTLDALKNNDKNGLSCPLY